jgi:hypothetical protein
VLKARGATGPSGYFAIVTRAYRDFLADDVHAFQPERSEPESSGLGYAGTLPRNPVSYPWFLELIEGFSWARNP